jgi:hypothetical protein
MLNIFWIIATGIPEDDKFLLYKENILHCLPTVKCDEEPPGCAREMHLCAFFSSICGDGSAQFFVRAVGAKKCAIKKLFYSLRGPPQSSFSWARVRCGPVFTLKYRKVFTEGTFLEFRGILNFMRK